MSDLTLARGRALPLALPALLLRPWVQVLLAWLVFLALRDWRWADLGVVFNDTDDAMRLQQVRDLLAGQSWFDLMQHRLDPDAPVPLHWSRLVDGPIAALVRLASLVLPAAEAERFAMAAWPPLTFLPVLAALRAASVRLGGERAAIPALVLAVTCLKATWQFFPGRIDHHNVQIALTCILLACLLVPRSWTAALGAGLTCGAMLAVGFETLPYVGVAGLAVALRYVIDGDTRNEAAMFGLGLAGCTALLFFLTVPVSRYGVSTCDALSASALGLAGGGGLALALVAQSLGSASIRVRLAAAAAAGIFALTVFGLTEPACLAGPFGQVNPAIRPIWLDHVDEVQPIDHVWAESRLRALMAVVDPILALLAVPLVLAACGRRGRFGAWVAVAFVAVSLAVGLVQVRNTVYPNLLAIPLLATAVVALARRRAEAGGSALVATLAGTMLASSTTLAVTLSLIPSIPAAGEAGRLAALTDRATCYDSRIYSSLAGAPPGRVLAFVESGPFLLLATPHAVLSAPYHRNAHGMIEAYRMLSATPAEAEALARQEGVDWVAICTHSSTLERMRRESADPGQDPRLALRLTAGEAPAWLEPVETGTPALLAFRVKTPR
jgi:asparagine N-glycosylation enzyme membrane subunit Stt3